MNIPPSATVVLNSLVQEKRARGERVHNLTVGEPVLPTPDVVRQAAVDAMNAGKTLYSPVQGIPELRSAAAAWMNARHGAGFTPAETVVTCGGKFGLFALLQALLEPDDEVLIIAPYWVSYPGMVSLFGGVPKIVETRAPIWKTSPEDLEAACTEKTKILIVNNGANPTGVLYAKEELASLLAVAKKYNLTVISDEVYSGLTYDGADYASAAFFREYRDRVFVIQSCSKHFAMTGWRVGFVFGPKELIDVVTMLQGQSTTGTASVSQWAALAAFEHADEIQPVIHKEMERRRDAFAQMFRECFGVSLPKPGAGLYYFIPLSVFGVSAAANDITFCREALENAGVALVPGSAFGARGFVRASFGGKPDEVREGLQALAEHCKQ